MLWVSVVDNQSPPETGGLGDERCNLTGCQVRVTTALVEVLSDRA